MDREDHRVLVARLLSLEMLGADDAVVVAIPGERREFLHAVDDVAAFDLAAVGLDRLGGPVVAALGNRLRVDHAVLDHAPELPLAHGPECRLFLRREVLHLVHVARPEHGGLVHVKGQRRGSAVLADLRADHRVFRNTEAQPAELLGDDELEESVIPQVVVVLRRKARIHVMPEGAGGKLLASELVRQAQHADVFV